MFISSTQALSTFIKFNTKRCGHLTLGNGQWRRYLTRYSKNDQIFVHPLSNGGALLSLSPKPEALPLGFSSNKDEITHENFTPNSHFVALLHLRIAAVIHHDLPFVIEAGTYANSFMPIYDFREVPRYGRTPEIDSTFGYVQVDDTSKIVPHSYEPNDMYRLCNGSGLIKLSDTLYEDMQQQCEKVNADG